MGRLRFGTTKSMESHPLDDPYKVCLTFGLALSCLVLSACLYIMFPCSYLGSVSGGSKSEKVQKEAGIDLGKFLHYANSDILDWHDLLNTTKIEGFLKVSGRFGAWTKWPGGKTEHYNPSTAFIIHR